MQKIHDITADKVKLEALITPDPAGPDTKPLPNPPNPPYGIRPITRFRSAIGRRNTRVALSERRRRNLDREQHRNERWPTTIMAWPLLENLKQITGILMLVLSRR